jgi:hypothetical protein
MQLNRTNVNEAVKLHMVCVFSNNDRQPVLRPSLHLVYLNVTL